MEAIVLAGGMGTRLRHLLPDIAKPMAPIAGRPFLEILLTRLAQGGVSRVILSLGYKAVTIRDYFGSNFAGMEIVPVVEQEPLGTGGAIRFAMEACQRDHFFVFNGDTFVDVDLYSLDAHWRGHRGLTVVAREVDDTGRYGGMQVEGERVIGFIEKGRSGPGLINAGCYVLPAGLLNGFPAGKAFSFEVDFLAKEVTTRAIDCFRTRGYFIDIGIPEDYLRAQKELPQLI